MRRLRRGDSDAREGRCDPGEQSADTATERRCANGDGEGNEDDKHSIFGRAGAALVNATAFEKTDHLKFLLQVRSGPMVNKRQSRSATACSA